MVKLFEFKEESYLIEEEEGSDSILIDTVSPDIPDCDDDDFSRAVRALPLHVRRLGHKALVMIRQASSFSILKKLDSWKSR